MLALLKKTCPTCTESSQRTYYQSILALSRFAGHDEIPKGPKWLNAALLGKLKKLPLHRYKRFTIGGVKALKAYGVDPDENEVSKLWWRGMRDATDKYTKIRLTGKRTKRESERWPKGGYAAIGKLAKQLHEEVAHIEKIRKPSEWEHYLYQRYVIVLFYAHHALRGDLADVRLRKGKGDDSWLLQTKKGWKIHIGHHKTIKSRGAIELELDGPVARAFDIFVPMARARKNHPFLLSTSRGKRLLRQDMLKLFSRTTSKYLGKKIGIQILRVLKTTSHASNIADSVKLQNEMGHSAAMQQQYISRK